MPLGKLTKSQMDELLPFYLNGSLSESECCQIEDWLRVDPVARQHLAEWQNIRLAITNQDEARPGNSVYPGLMKRIQSARVEQPVRSWRPVFSLEWVAAAILSLLVLFGLWKAVAPGISLEWSLQGDGVSAFRIYRAKADQQHFELISEIPVQAGIDQYNFVDVWLIPGGDYVYRIEGVGQSGDLAISRSITSNSIGVLPGQLAILLTSMMIGLSGLHFFAALHSHLWVNSKRPQFT